MKKTLTINLGGIVFHIDEDAYLLLNQYLENLKRHFSKQEGSQEILNDIESRIAEILAEKRPETKQVITLEDVNGVIAIMDFKCPGSGESGAMDLGNVERLRPCDEVKFVIGDRADFEWARDLSVEHALPERCRAVLFSPVHGALEAAMLAGWVLEERLPVRVQLPLHKMMGMK